MAEFGLNPGTVALIVVVLGHIVTMVWWSSSVHSRLKTLEENKQNFNNRIDLLEAHIQETKRMLHNMEVLLARIDERVGSKKASLAETP